MNDSELFEPLLAFLERLPAIDLPAGRKSIGTGIGGGGRWWGKFSLDTSNPLAWRVVQELAYVLNYLALDQSLPTVFKPVSPPPYLNGGVEFLSWAIESQEATFTAGECAHWLEGRLPDPVSDPAAWEIDNGAGQQAAT